MDVAIVPEVIAGFERMGFLNCAVVIDDACVPMVYLPQAAHKYVNCKRCKGYYLIIIQVLANHRGRFMNISVGSTGKDAEVI